MNPYDINLDFHTMVKTIINDRDMLKIIQNISVDQIYDINCYLDNKLYYNLIELLKNIYVSEKIGSKIIGYHKICLDKKIKLGEILLRCKRIIMKAGNYNYPEHKNIVMKGMTLTINSIINRQFNPIHIDDNLREGARKRKAYISQEYHKKEQIYKGVVPIFGKYTPIKAKQNKSIISEVSIHPSTEGKHVIYEQNENEIKQLPSEIETTTTTENYQKGVKILNQIKPTSPLNATLSKPLTTPPVGKSGKTVITPKATLSRTEAESPRYISTTTIEKKTNQMSEPVQEEKSNEVKKPVQEEKRKERTEQINQEVQKPAQTREKKCEEKSVQINQEVQKPVQVREKKSEERIKQNKTEQIDNSVVGVVELPKEKLYNEPPFIGG